MGVEAIVARIEQDFEEDIRHLRKDAEKEAASIIEKAQRDAADAAGQIIAGAERECAAITARELSKARIEARTLVREAKDSLLHRCVEEAEKNLVYISHAKAYSTILRRLIEEGIEGVGGGDVVVISTERDRSMVEEILAALPGHGGAVTCGHECAVCAGGVIVKSASGGITVNNTFEARFERNRSNLLFAVSRLLFKGV